MGARLYFSRLNYTNRSVTTKLNGCAVVLIGECMSLLPPSLFRISGYCISIHRHFHRLGVYIRLSSSRRIKWYI